MQGITNEYLQILNPVLEDNNIKSYQFREYTPISVELNRGGEIIIDVNAANNYLLPSESYLMIDGRLLKDNLAMDTYAAADEVSLINNAMMYLFNQISYSIGDTPMERILNPGQISSMLGYLKYPDDYSTSSALKACWSKDTTNSACSSKYMPSVVVPAAGVAAGALTPIDNAEYNQGFHTRKSFLMSADPRGTFQFMIPFSHMFGFAEYKKVIWGVKHSLKLTMQSNLSLLAIHRTAGVDLGKIRLDKVAWFIPHVQMEPVARNELMKVVEKKESIPVAFVGRNGYNTAVPRDCTQFNWRMPTQGGVEKPRWVIVGFQTDRASTQEQNPATFDHLSLTNAYITLNSDRYPTSDLNVNFTTNRYMKLYNMFEDFQQEYYGISSLVGGSQVNVPAFKTLFPIIVFDVRNQDEEIKTGAIDMDLSIYFSERVPADTMAYACVLSDRQFNFASDGRSISVKSL